MRQARYPYAWAPVVVVIGTAVVLAVPYLALIALIFVLVAALAAVTALAWTTITALFVRGRVAHRRWRPQQGGGQPSPVLSQARRDST
jgi:hypothetical protein